MNQNQVGFLFYLRLHGKKQTNKKTTQNRTNKTAQIERKSNSLANFQTTLEYEREAHPVLK